MLTITLFREKWMSKKLCCWNYSRFKLQVWKLTKKWGYQGHLAFDSPAAHDKWLKFTHSDVDKFLEETSKELVEELSKCNFESVTSCFAAQREDIGEKATRLMAAVERFCATDKVNFTPRMLQIKHNLLLVTCALLTCIIYNRSKEPQDQIEYWIFNF